MPYNFVADSIHTSKLCGRLSSSEVHFLTENGDCLCFGAHFFLGGEAEEQRMLIILDSLERECTSY